MAEFEANKGFDQFLKSGEMMKSDETDWSDYIIPPTPTQDFRTDWGGVKPPTDGPEVAHDLGIVVADIPVVGVEVAYEFGIDVDEKTNFV